jgi:ABC-type phosphate transport system permease subunit
MAWVLFFLATFVVGLIAIAILEPLSRRFLKPLGVPGDVLQAVFIGAGALIVLPFVLSILAEAHVSIVSSMIAGAIILCHAGAAFLYAIFRLLLPLARVPLSKKH